MTSLRNRRILVIDDNPAIHLDFAKILGLDRKPDELLRATELSLFPETANDHLKLQFEMESAYQGEEGVALVERARESGRPFAMAFVDVRMPPGFDGIETTARIWEKNPDLLVVLCTAYADYSFLEIQMKLGLSDCWVILKKPFENIEVLQLAHALTEKWNLAREAQSRLDDLEQKVSERTRDLLHANQNLRAEMEERQRIEEQLRESQKLETVGRLSAGVAHNFNNLLTVIQGHTSLLQAEANLDYDSRSSLDEVATAVKRAASLTSQLLTFSRRQFLRLRPVDLNAAIQASIDRLRRHLGKGMSLDFKPADSLPPIQADAALFEQALTCLTVNARDAMPPDGRLFIRTAQVNIDRAYVQQNAEAREGPHICVTIQDNGTGVDPLIMDRLFEPFFTTKDVGQGYGLGLSMVYGIVKQHQGWIDVESAHGHGVTFKLYLPVQTGPLEESSSP